VKTEMRGKTLGMTNYQNRTHAQVSIFPSKNMFASNLKLDFSFKVKIYNSLGHIQNVMPCWYAHELNKHHTCTHKISFIGLQSLPAVPSNIQLEIMNKNHCHLLTFRIW
jgi:hypothetical protein